MNNVSFMDKLLEVGDGKPLKKCVGFLGTNGF